MLVTYIEMNIGVWFQNARGFRMHVFQVMTIYILFRNNTMK